MILYPENIKDYPKIITSIKYYFSHNINVGVETPTYGYLNKGEKGIWEHYIKVMKSNPTKEEEQEARLTVYNEILKYLNK